MKITIVQGAFFPVPPLMGGALEKIWFSLGQEFARRGHSVTHISRSYGNLPQDKMLEDVRYIRIPSFDTPQSSFTLKLYDLIYSWRVKQVLPIADILITNTFWLPILVRDCKYGKLYVHAARYPKGQMKLYGHADRIQTVSSPIANAIIQEIPNLKSKVHYISNPLPEEMGSSINLQVLENREKWILYVGRVHPEKGIDLLIGAFQHLMSFGFNDWKLVIVGPWETKYGGGGEAYYQHLRNLSQQIHENINWVGAVFDPAKLQTYYRQATLFVYPSLAEKGETFGLAVLEAMANGTPVLVSDLKCFQDYIVDETTGYIFDRKAPDPTVHLAKKLLEIINSSEQLMKVGRNGYEKSQDYTLPRIADLYLSDFESLLKS